jgi:hypothetical protein
MSIRIDARSQSWRAPLRLTIAAFTTSGWPSLANAVKLFARSFAAARGDAYRRWCARP